MNRKSIIELGKDVKMAHDLLLAGMPMIVFDLETTGLSPDSDRILSFSAQKIVLNNGIADIQETKDIFINPGFHIPENVTAINGITDEMVADAPSEDESYKEIKEFLGPKPFLCGYNSSKFDEKFLHALYARHSNTLDPFFHIDVLKMAREKLNLSSYKLSLVAKELGVDTDLVFHHSMDDVKATYRCFEMLKADYYVPDKTGDTKVLIRGFKYWKGPNHHLERIYIQTWPETKTWYDAYRKEWVSEDDNVDLDYIKQQSLKNNDVSDEIELLKKLKR